MQKLKVIAQQECTQSKRSILKTLNEKYTKSTLKLTDQIGETWQKKVNALKEKVIDLDLYYCDWKTYLEENKDVSKAFGHLKDKHEKAKNHWLKHGRVE